VFIQHQIVNNCLLLSVILAFLNGPKHKL